MANYLLAYHGGKMGETKEEIAKIMALWDAWIKQCGPALIDGGNPVGKAKYVASDGKVTDGGGANPVSGYSIIKVDSMEIALKVAGMCPILAGGGSVEVCETFNAM